MGSKGPLQGMGDTNALGSRIDAVRGEQELIPQILNRLSIHPNFKNYSTVVY